MVERAHPKLVPEFRFARWEALCTAVDNLLRLRPTANRAQLADRTRQYTFERTELGLQSVPIYKIVSDKRRYAEFDEWLPYKQHLSSSSHTLCTPAADGPPPPIELYKIAEHYFVKDGSSRVMAARLRGQLFLPAHVIKYTIDSSLDSLTDAYDVLLLVEQQALLDTTRLARLRHNHQVACMALGAYPRIAHHIELYCHELRARWNRSMSLEVAAASWYDTLYMPLVNVARRQGVFDVFSCDCAGDLYLWAMDYRPNLRQMEYFPYSATFHTAHNDQPDQRLRERLAGALRDVIALGRAIQSHTTTAINH